MPDGMDGYTTVAEEELASYIDEAMSAGAADGLSIATALVEKGIEPYMAEGAGEDAGLSEEDGPPTDGEFPPDDGEMPELPGMPEPGADMEEDEDRAKRKGGDARKAAAIFAIGAPKS